MSRADILLERLPAPMTAAEYESASKRIEALLLATPGVIAVYRTGSVSAPGISDIDRIAVTNGVDRVEGVWRKLTGGEKYAAMHSPFIASSATFAEHSWYANVQPLDLVAGEEIDVDSPTADAELISKLLAIEGLVVLRLKLEKQRVTGRIKVRPFLCELNNLRHCLRLGDLDDRAAPSAWEVSRTIEELRTAWWERAPDERATTVIEVFAAAPSAIDSALDAIRAPVDRTPATDVIVLRAPWANVWLTTKSPRRLGRVPRTLSHLSRRAAELFWRSSRRNLHVPAPILSTLVELRCGSGIYADRRTRVLRYRDFVRSAGQGWSQLGAAGVFAP